MSRLHRSKARRNAREIRKQLRTIYERADGRIPDLSKLDRGGRSRLTRFLINIIGLLAILSLIAWLGFFAFTKGFFEEEEVLNLTVEGPEEVKAGEEVSFTFRYENRGNVPVASLAMKLTVPSTFHVYTNVPEPEGVLEWTIGSLNTGSDGAITVTGVFLSEVPSSQRLQALFTYKPANFSSDFEDLVTKKVEVNDSVLTLSLSGPEKALAGDTSEYVVNIQNTGTSPVYNIRVIPTFPTDFVSSESQPAPEEGRTYWPIDELEPGEMKAITIQGSFTATASQEQTFSVGAGFVDQDVVYLQSVQTVVTDVLEGSISFTVIVNGSNQNQTADVGESLLISLAYENNSQETARGLQLAMALASEEGEMPIDWPRADLDGGVRSGNEVSWESLPDLGPNEANVIDVSLPIDASIDAQQADVFTLSFVLTLHALGSVTSTRTLEATPIVITLNSDTSLNAQARYYSESGEAIGLGPLPPKVGETTTYRVYFNLSNSLHTLENIQISATIPVDVTWLESTDTDIGTVAYSVTIRQVTWIIPKLPAEMEHAGAWFDIAINPDEEDVGQFMKLISSTSFVGQDASTGKSMSLSSAELTTELSDDTFAVGKGTVIE